MLSSLRGGGGREEGRGGGGGKEEVEEEELDALLFIPNLFFLFSYLFFFVTCTRLYKSLWVHWSLSPLVRWSVGPLVRQSVLFYFFGVLRPVSITAPAHPRRLMLLCIWPCSANQTWSLAGWAPDLAGWASGLAGWVSGLAGWASCLVGWASGLAGLPRGGTNALTDRKSSQGPHSTGLCLLLGLLP